MSHALCGQHFAPALTCTTCREVVRSGDVRTEWGPSGSWERSVPESSTRRRSDPGADRTTAGLFPETMAIFGNRWSVGPHRRVAAGLTRFGDFEEALGAPPSLVAERLRAFCDIGVLEARGRRGRVASRVPGRAEYRLTEKGNAFYPVVAVATEWAQHWYAAEEGPALVQQHACRAGRVARHSRLLPVSTSRGPTSTAADIEVVSRARAGPTGRCAQGPPRR